MTDAFNSALDQVVSAYGEIGSGVPSAKLRRVADLLATVAGTVHADADLQVVRSLQDRLVNEVESLERRRGEVKAFKAQLHKDASAGGLPGLSLDQAVAIGADHAPPASAGVVPPAKVEEFKNLYELFAKAGTTLARSTTVKQIRDFIAGLEFWTAKWKAVESLDDAIRTGTGSVIQIAMQELFKAVTGHPAPDPTVDIITPEAPGEHLFHTPKFSLPGDAPAKVPERTTFLISGVRGPYAPGAGITFTLSPPKHFFEINGGKRVVIVADADRKQIGAAHLAEHALDSDQPQPVTFTAPAQPGKYVVRVEIGMSFEDESIVDFQVAAG